MNSWQEFDLTKKKEEWEEVAEEISKARERASTSRKGLGQKTKALKGASNEDKIAQFPALLKAYQMEIDALTKRALKVETSFMAIFTGMEGLEDPCRMSVGQAGGTEDGREAVERAEQQLAEERERCKGLLEALERAKSENEAREDEAERQRMSERQEWEQEMQKQQVKWTRRENELMRERDSALRREAEAKRERDNQTQNSSTMDMSYDEEQEALHDVFTREQESRLWELGAQIGLLKEELQRRAQEERQRVQEMEDSHDKALTQQRDQHREEMEKLREERERERKGMEAERREAVERLERELLEAQKKIHNQQIQGQQLQHQIDTLQKQAHDKAFHRPKEVVVTPSSSSSSSSSTSSSAPVVRSDWLSLLLRYKPARSFLLLYIPLVHILLFLVLYLNASCTTKNINVKFHPFHPNTGTVRQFLAHVYSPNVANKFPELQVSCEVEYENDMKPEITVVYENKETRIIDPEGMKIQELFDEISSVLKDMEIEAQENEPEHQEENPYFQIAKQKEEKLEAKRKKMLAMMDAKPKKKRN